MSSAVPLPTPDGALVLGVDAGGTATRAMLASIDGRALATGAAGGANQRSSGGDPATRIAEAIEVALVGVEPSRVVRGVVAAAGAGGAGRVGALAAARTAWRASGLSGTPEVVTDIEAAFAAGTTRPAGLLLAAGTGAVAAAFEQRTLVRRADGYGWLAGDAGSAVWLGRAAVRAVLASLDGRTRPTRLLAPVCATLLDGDGDGDGGGGWEPAPPPGSVAARQLAQRIVQAVAQGQPADLGRLAPPVEQAALAGDRAASRLISAAVRQLVRTLRAVVTSATPQPMVLAGALLAPEALVGVRLRAVLDAPVCYARTGAPGAAALACHRAASPALAHLAHERLLEGRSTGRQ